METVGGKLNFSISPVFRANRPDGHGGDGEMGRWGDARLFETQAQLPSFAFPMPLAVGKSGVFNNF
jgi:hypothetical protein